MYLQFEIADTDNSGSLSLEEVRHIVADQNHADQFMDKFDLDKDGIVTMEEFKEVLGIVNAPMPDFRKVFSDVDKDSSGSVSIQELKIHFKESGHEVELPKLEDYLKKYDKDGNGQLEYREFLSFLLEIM
ncbi:hypothetical protein Ciccas_008817 [Cichlidogyrus casuarinus]|uniref:EF-hand domain-containing protein n=1 Tax=Cichlidogyrus casuarinus TaxID=1844966 RepID=A0ABD2PYT7_9PLAT